jgi:hypothetical protein
VNSGRNLLADPGFPDRISFTTIFLSAVVSSKAFRVRRAYRPALMVIHALELDFAQAPPKHRTPVIH